MVFHDRYFYQRRLFYSTKWTKAMEATFVNMLVEHKKHGNFNRNGINFHEVMCAIYDVNKEHSTKLMMRKLKERYVVFSWILNVSRVLVNKVRRYVLADDAIWEKMIQDFENADEPTLINDEEEVDSIASFYPPLGWVDDSPHTFYQNIMLAHIDQLDTTPIDSTSLWRFLEEYYASDDKDEVNSMLALPAAPPSSLDPNYVSMEHTSSSASNEISKSQ
ncbi:hypothetical protein Salat_1159500 [Sesamum alatum]|uniref:Myb/SANT-like domain-containing protein n=1 Tax=Sesamum alatum TaxID=300844 RepID=A0AAE2CNF1_9LAMI|nr:hypothetical protein Salat_1159500 [Sesamum alatum]